MIEQLQHHPVVILLPSRLARYRALPGIHIKPHDLLEIRDNSAQDAAGLQNPDTFSDEVRGFGLGEMFEHMGVVNHLE